MFIVYYLKKKLGAKDFQESILNNIELYSNSFQTIRDAYLKTFELDEDPNALPYLSKVEEIATDFDDLIDCIIPSLDSLTSLQQDAIARAFYQMIFEFNSNIDGLNRYLCTKDKVDFLDKYEEIQKMSYEIYLETASFWSYFY